MRKDPQSETIPIHVPAPCGLAISGYPIEIGVPFPRGFLKEVGRLRLYSSGGESVPCDLTESSRWPDGTLRWVLLRFLAGGADYQLRFGADSAGWSGVRLDTSEHGSEVRVDTGVASFVLARDWFSLRSSTGVFSAGPALWTDTKGPRHGFRIDSVEFEHRGSVSTIVLLRGRIARRPGRPICEGECRLSFWAGTALIRIEFTLWNPRAARHRGGLWDLGDPESVFFRSLHVPFHFPRGGTPTLSLSVEPCGELIQSAGEPVSIHQSSSGGPDWRSLAHVDKDNVPTPKFRGFRLSRGETVTEGFRANPAAIYEDSSVCVAFALEDFWQRFPSRLELREGLVSVEPFPEADEQEYELQGGEKATFRLWADFHGSDQGTAVLPARHKLHALLPPEWYRATGCIPGLSSSEEATDPYLAALMRSGVDGPYSFFDRRDQFEEYGWRNFGEVPADHERLHYKGKRALVSHYNNQYDLVLGFLNRCAATADPRWLTLGCDLARHVIDHDLYSTSQDKSAYNGGYFWHSPHYLHAGTATHRAYSRLAADEAPPAKGFGGGPSSEHNYATGLALYYLMTGDSRARAAVVQLAAWVRDMQDGWKTPLRFLSRNQTGRSTCTADLSFQGPGRGAGYSVNACLDAFLVTGDSRWLLQAEQFVRTCVHPNDDPDAMGLLRREERWSYVVFLQALGRYLDVKEETGENDAAFGYAQASLVRYARWMLEREYPYLDKPEELEYPSSTWAAQELRKSCVFLHVARHVSSEDAAAFRNKGAFFVQKTQEHLSRFEDANCTRCLALLLSNYPLYVSLSARVAQGEVGTTRGSLRSARTADFGPKAILVPQKIDAVRRLRRIIRTLGLAGLVELARYLRDLHARNR